MDRDTQNEISDRAVKIAAQIMVESGICRYEHVYKCRKVLPPTQKECTACIKRMLLSQAKKELKRERNKR